MGNEVYYGDCLEIMPTLPDGSIDMILCDLPYGVTSLKWDSIIPFDPLWREYKRLIKDSGVIVLTASQPFASALIMSNLNMFKYEWIWEKNCPSNIMTCKKQPLRYHENVLVFYKNQCTYNPQMRASEWDNRNRKGIVYEVNKGVTGKTKSYANESHNPKEKYPKSVLFFSKDWRPQDSLHPTQKPVALFEYLIKTYTNEGDLVLDNCAGSFTTAIAAMNTNRDYVCIEKDDKYFELGCKRIAQHQQKTMQLEF